MNKKDREEIEKALGKTRGRKLSRKGLVKKADEAASRWARKTYPQCFWCGNKTENAFHFLTRSKRSIRWQEDNLIGSCAGCNIRYEQDQGFVEDVIRWYRRNRGDEKWEHLKAWGNALKQHTDLELVQIIKYYESKMGE